MALCWVDTQQTKEHKYVESFALGWYKYYLKTVGFKNQKAILSGLALGLWRMVSCFMRLIRNGQCSTIAKRCFTSHCARSIEAAHCTTHDFSDSYCTTCWSSWTDQPDDRTPAGGNNNIFSTLSLLPKLNHFGFFYAQHVLACCLRCCFFHCHVVLSSLVFHDTSWVYFHWSIGDQSPGFSDNA